MMAIRLPTGLLEGNAFNESACKTRMDSGSRCKISATTVDTKVSWDWPEDEVPINAVMCPDKSTRTKQESIQVVVSFFGLNKGSNDEFPPEGSKQVDIPIPANKPSERKASRSLSRSSKDAAAMALPRTVL